MLEEARQDVASEVDGVEHEERFAVFAPGDVLSESRILEHTGSEKSQSCVGGSVYRDSLLTPRLCGQTVVSSGLGLARSNLGSNALVHKGGLRLARRRDSHRREQTTVRCAPRWWSRRARLDAPTPRVARSRVVAVLFQLVALIFARSFPGMVLTTRTRDGTDRREGVGRVSVGRSRSRFSGRSDRGRRRIAGRRHDEPTRDIGRRAGSADVDEQQRLGL